MFGSAARSDPPQSPDDRAVALVARMTLDEKIALVHSRFGMPIRGQPAPAGALDSAAFVPGIPRLGIPPLQETDAGLGIANPTNAPFDATAMPSALAVAATFDTDLAETAGAAVGAEARAMGFSVLLGGGADLIREPRGGRNFEYASEDPLLTGSMVAGSGSRRTAHRRRRHRETFRTQPAGERPRSLRCASRRGGGARIGPARLRTRDRAWPGPAPS